MSQSIGIVIWAHSKCRSTFSLYREVMRQSPVPVRLAFWKGIPEQRIAQGFSAEAFDEIDSVFVGDDWHVAENLLGETVGWTHVVAGYQVSAVYQRVMREAKSRGDRVVVYSEAPCEMCLGAKALLKRFYYRFVLPRKLKPVVKCADLILSQSGMQGIDRLLRLGWKRGQIVPFGYASPKLNSASHFDATSQPSDSARSLRVLHLGSEAPYRGVGILEQAVRQAARRGVQIELRKTGGQLSQNELVQAIRSADVVVGCGICEPWGMRINDAVQEGVPVIVSEGMGVAYMVEQEGCGLVVPTGDADALSKALVRCAQDGDFLMRLRRCAEKAAEQWSPGTRAKEFLRIITQGEG